MNGNRINININDVTLTGLLDSGASRSCLDSSYMHKLDIDEQAIDKSFKRLLLSADGRRLKVLGNIDLAVAIYGIVTDFNFTIVEGLLQGLILGNDFLQKFRCKIDFVQNTITFFGDEICQNILQGQTKSSSGVL